MFLRYVAIFIVVSINFIHAKEISISVESRFLPFVKKMEKRQSLYIFNVQKKSTSFDAFKDIKKGKVSLAIVRGDILVDNNSSKKIKIISKLKSPTFLYLVSKSGVNNAYDLLNSDEKKDGVKYISVGHLNDLSNIYLKDIAKNVYSQYSFRYKYFSPEASFKKLKEDKIDAGYLFLSPSLVKKAKKMGFKLQKIVKAKNRINLSKKIESQKAFTMLSNGIRVDNYLVASSSLSKKMLKSLLLALKKQGILLTSIKSEFGRIDSRVKGISKEIDQEIKEVRLLALKKEKACKSAKLKRLKLSSLKRNFRRVKENIFKKIKAVKSTINSDGHHFNSSLKTLRNSVKSLDREFITLVKKVQNKKLKCNVSKTDKYLKLLTLKASKLNRCKSKLKKIEKKILLAKKEAIKKEKEIIIVKQEIIAKEPVVVSIPLSTPAKKEHSTVSREREDRGYR